MPHLENLYKRFKAEGFVVLGVNADNDTKDKVESIKTSFNVTFPLLILGNAVAVDKYNMSRFPTSVFIDRAGNIAHRELGFHGAGSIESRVRELLGK